VGGGGGGGGGGREGKFFPRLILRERNVYMRLGDQGKGETGRSMKLGHEGWHPSAGLLLSHG